MKCLATKREGEVRTKTLARVFHTCSKCVYVACVSHRAPPQSISVGGKLLVEFFLHQIDQEGGED